MQRAKSTVHKRLILLGGIALLGLLVWAVSLFLRPPPADAVNDIYDSTHYSYRAETVTTGFAHPWSLAFLPDGRMLVTQRAGQLILLNPNTGTRTKNPNTGTRTNTDAGDAGTRIEVGGLPDIAAGGQGGLMDVALHPAFPDEAWVYLSFTAAGEGGRTTHVGRGRLQGQRLEDFEVLFVAEPYVGGGRHFGSRLVFDRDGYLFITVGDRGNRDNAQALGNYHGTLIRLTADGEIPEDNPFVDEPGARPEIYSYGHRNAQGMAVHPETGDLWLHEHGPRGGDELNRPRAGLNFGWPETTYGREYYGPTFAPEPPQPGFEPPVHHWTPSIAPSGMAFYDGDAFPQWRGDLFVGALAHRQLHRLRLDGHEVVEEEVLLDDLRWRIRDVRNGPDGYLYVLPDERNASLIRLVPAD